MTYLAVGILKSDPGMTNKDTTTMHQVSRASLLPNHRARTRASALQCMSIKADRKAMAATEVMEDMEAKVTAATVTMGTMTTAAMATEEATMATEEEIKEARVAATTAAATKTSMTIQSTRSSVVTTTTTQKRL